MTLNIQLVLQGGGAKICGLMAAMEAVQDYENKGLLKVTRIAGTSAGAIIGSLFAAEISMNTLRGRLKAGEGLKLLQKFPDPGIWGFIKMILGGNPLWDTSELQKGLETLFAEKGIRTFADMKREMLVVAADLGDSSMVVRKDSDNVVNSIMDSCGLPYFFRTWNKNGGRVVVDGGICENLPITLLTDSDQEPVVAIGFAPTPLGSPNSVGSFTKALLDTAMNNSIDRAKRALRPGAIHIVKPEFGAFDFEVALRNGLGIYYDYEKTKAEIFLKQFIETNKNEPEANAVALPKEEQKVLKTKKASETQSLKADFWTDPCWTTATLMEQLGKVYKAQHLKVHFKYLKCTFAVQANSFLEEGEDGFGTLDSYSYRLTFKALNEPIDCISIALDINPEAGFLGKSQWTVRDANKNLIETIDVPCRNPDDPDSRELMLFFNPPIQPASGYYDLLFQDAARSLMEPLLTQGKDVLEFYPRRAFESIDQIDLILYVPDRLKNAISMHPNLEKAQQGRMMTAGELTDYDTPIGFHCLGWRGSNLDIEKVFGVNLVYNKG